MLLQSGFISFIEVADFYGEKTIMVPLLDNLVGGLELVVTPFGIDPVSCDDGHDDCAFLFKYLRELSSDVFLGAAELGCMFEVDENTQSMVITEL